VEAHPVRRAAAETEITPALKLIFI